MKKISLLLALSFTLLSLVSPWSPQIKALSGADFRPGRIMDDGVFFNSYTMSPQDIQQFLNAKIANGTCDTYGTKPYGGTTRAAYAASRGYPAPFTCLKDYVQTSSTRMGDGLCGGYIGGTKSAAQMIYDVSIVCGVNPRVLLVLLEKEQSLVTDDWPWSVQYQSPTGFGCPDTAPCDSQFGAFFDQIYYAARQFKKYARDSTQFRYRANMVNYIQYNPNAGCGGSNVFIENQATAGLYNYTPYQPNASALNNLYGSGDSCGAYGNRNFWRLFNDWFGPVFVGRVLPPCNAPSSHTSCVFSLTKPFNQTEFLTSSVEERNSLVYYHGFQYNGIKFYSSNITTPSTTAMYRLFSPSLNKHFWTPFIAERDYLLANGYVSEGAPFNVNSAASNDGYPVRRMVKGFRHVWVTTDTERSGMASQGYIDEGLVFHSLSPVQVEPATTSGQQTVYRVVSTITGKHFWTTNRLERDSLLTRAEYIYEGLGWYGVATPNSVPIYRLYSPSQNRHFWTSNIVELNALLSRGFINEGIGFYAATPANSNPIYRLYSPSLNRHFFTSNVLEKDFLTVNGYIFEGIGWYSN